MAYVWSGIHRLAEAVSQQLPFGLSANYIMIVIGTFIVHELAWIGANALYVGLDHFKLLQKYKIDPSYYPSQELVLSSIQKLAMGHIFQLLPVIAVFYPFLTFCGFHSSETLPTIQEFATQFVIFNIIEDTGFYWVHRAMHHPTLYKRFHYRHHDFVSPFSLSGEISHPVEFVFNILVPLMAGPVVMGLLQGTHVVTFWIWITFREVRGADAHSGYDLPFHPLKLIRFAYGGPVAHHFHHTKYGGKSNLGGYKFWDWIMGTDVSYRRWLDKRQAAK